ncbi:hypothetical protein EDD18DRAFT_1363371 [Armillaria luteobubalina]|uniref:Ribonuclease H1 N-terminal domain-containing protein n=1 Tax=Armillaria luteobubalina TaxID=153913 RepID=A0AA39UC12_9AGAR|nr:hypothetical protein EDD18DRAFT_1363371 [Armillaria luteobubalina]
MPPSPKHYLESLDSAQLAQLISALVQRGLVSAPAALPTGSGAPYSATCTEPSHSHPTSSLSDSGTTLGVADVAETLSLPRRLPTPRKARRGRSSGSRSQHTRPNAQTTWYTVTVGYKVGVFQGWNAVAPSVLDLEGAVYLPHTSHAAACAHYASTMANDQVEIVLTDNKDDT